MAVPGGWRKAAVALGILSLTSASAMAGTSQFNGTWVLAEIGGVAVRHSSATAPFFTLDGQIINGFDGCNRFSGRLDAPGQIVATRRGCPDATLMLPLDLNRLAAHIESGKLAGGWLRIPARRGFPASGFKRRN